MTPIQVNQIKRNTIRRKGVGKTRNMTCQTHHRATILIRPTIVIIAANNATRRAIRKGSDKLCTQLTAKLLTTAYKSKIINFKLNEDPLQYQIYFLTFVESLEMTFYRTKKLVEYF